MFQTNAMQIERCLFGRHGGKDNIHVVCRFDLAIGLIGAPQILGPRRFLSRHGAGCFLGAFQKLLQFELGVPSKGTIVCFVCMCRLVYLIIVEAKLYFHHSGVKRARDIAVRGFGSRGIFQLGQQLLIGKRRRSRRRRCRFTINGTNGSLAGDAFEELHGSSGCGLVVCGQEGWRCW